MVEPNAPPVAIIGPSAPNGPPVPIAIADDMGFNKVIDGLILLSLLLRGKIILYTGSLVYTLEGAMGSTGVEVLQWVTRMDFTYATCTSTESTHLTFS